MGTTVLLVDDHELIRQGLARAFERDDEMTVVGQAGSLAEGVTAWLRPAQRNVRGATAACLAALTTSDARVSLPTNAEAPASARP